MSPREPLPDPLFTDVVLPPLFKGVDDAGANLVKELAHAMVSAFNAIAGQAATAMDIVQASVKGVGGAIQEGVKIILGAEAAANIDLSGDLFAFIGSLQDVIIDERLLTSGPLDFATVLRYENRLAGLRMVIVMVSSPLPILLPYPVLWLVKKWRMHSPDAAQPVDSPPMTPPRPTGRSPPPWCRCSSPRRRRFWEEADGPADEPRRGGDQWRRRPPGRRHFRSVSEPPSESRGGSPPALPGSSE